MNQFILDVESDDPVIVSTNSNTLYTVGDVVEFDRYEIRHPNRRKYMTLNGDFEVTARKNIIDNRGDCQVIWIKPVDTKMIIDWTETR